MAEKKDYARTWRPASKASEGPKRSVAKPKKKTASTVQKLTPAEAKSFNKGKKYLATKSGSGAYTPISMTPSARTQAAANRGNAAAKRAVAKKTATKKK